MELNGKSEIFVPDGKGVDEALARTTHMVIAAHQDDIELMAFAPIAECFGREDKWLCGVVVADGANSPRAGLYADYTDERMMQIRVAEQKKAAYVGEYGAQVMLGYPSAVLKDDNGSAVDELVRILTAARPRYLYTHNLADKHLTHVAVAVKTIKAVRRLDKSLRPEKLYGCEGWRDLDWLSDEEKVCFDTAAHPNIAASLMGVYDSQICGGKRYDLATNGRRTANATYAESHGCDSSSSLSYAVDLTALIKDDGLNVSEFIAEKIRRFEKSVRDTIDGCYR